jgi:hypothetical protein
MRSLRERATALRVCSRGGFSDHEEDPGRADVLILRGR